MRFEWLVLWFVGSLGACLKCLCPRYTFCGIQMIQQWVIIQFDPVQVFNVRRETQAHPPTHAYTHTHGPLGQLSITGVCRNTADGAGVDVVLSELADDFSLGVGILFFIVLERWSD